MNKLEVTKNVVSFVVGVGTSQIVKTIIKNNVQPENVIEKITVTAGSFVLGAIYADASRKYTDTKIDELVDWWNTNVKKTPVVVS
jgi:hypothetical protein